MKYYISQGFLQPPLEIEIEGPPPCLFCGKLVHEPSMNGPLVCPSCDCGRNTDGSRWTNSEAHERHAHYAAAIAAYRTMIEAKRPPKSLLDWGPDGLYDDTRAVHLHGICHGQRDGECSWRECPQRNNYKSHCPLDRRTADED